MGGEEKREFQAWDAASKLPAGNPDKLSDKVPVGCQLAWGLGLLEALYHHHRHAGVARTSKPPPLFYPQGSPSSALSIARDSMQLL